MYICFPLARDLEAEYLSQKCASYRPVVRCLETPLYVDDLRFEVFSMAAPHRAAFSSAMARSPRLCISSPVHRSDVFEGDQLLSLHATSFRCVLRGQLKRQLERWGMGFGITWVLRSPHLKESLPQPRGGGGGEGNTVDWMDPPGHVVAFISSRSCANAEADVCFCRGCHTAESMPVDGSIHSKSWTYRCINIATKQNSFPATFPHR